MEDQERRSRPRAGVYRPDRARPGHRAAANPGRGAARRLRGSGDVRLVPAAEFRPRAMLLGQERPGDVQFEAAVGAPLVVNLRENSRGFGDFACRGRCGGAPVNSANLMDVFRRRFACSRIKRALLYLFRRKGLLIASKRGVVEDGSLVVFMSRKFEMVDQGT